MKFNDYKLINDKESIALNNTYSKIVKQEVDDLNEILEKMYKQRDILEKESSKELVVPILKKLNEDIHKLEEIVHNNSYSKVFDTTYSLSIPSSHKKVRKLDEERLSPYRSIEENEGYLNTPIRTRQQRGRPLQSLGVINLFKNFGIKKNPLNNEVFDNRLRYHTVITTTCHPHKQIVNNQIDIVRLLLLYMLLRPTCKYMPIIASITNNQFESYVNLSEL